MFLANPRQVYRGERPGGRHHIGRRAYNFAEFINLPTSEMDIGDDEDDFGNLLDGATGSAEGARFNTDLFEAYGSHAWSPFSRRLGTSPSPPLEDEPPIWRPQSTLGSTGRSSAWAAVPTSTSTSSTSLTRHPSIRRPTRSRLGDLNDWTSRRRSSIRDSIGNQGETLDNNPPLSLGNNGESSQTVRRFFPTITRRLERRSEPREDRNGSDEGRLFPLGVSVDREWSPALGTTQGGSSTSEQRPNGTSGTGVDDRPSPRLRRGGVRPPEMFWTHRYPWPAPRPSSRPADTVTNGSSITVSPSLTPVDHVRSVSPGREDAGTTSAEPVGYPTPSSIDTEPASV